MSDNNTTLVFFLNHTSQNKYIKDLGLTNNNDVTYLRSQTIAGRPTHCREC